jgi:hypothetical protein
MKSGPLILIDVTSAIGLKPITLFAVGINTHKKARATPLRHFEPRMLQILAIIAIIAITITIVVVTVDFIINKIYMTDWWQTCRLTSMIEKMGENHILSHSSIADECRALLASPDQLADFEKEYCYWSYRRNKLSRIITMMREMIVTRIPPSDSAITAESTLILDNPDRFAVFEEEYRVWNYRKPCVYSAECPLKAIERNLCRNHLNDECWHSGCTDPPIGRSKLTDHWIYFCDEHYCYICKSNSCSHI